jgi:secreted trypsin-like serine protease
MTPFSRQMLGVAMAAALAWSLAPTASARTPAPTSGPYPFVGLVLFGSGGEVSHACSGALVAPRTLLTAGHCTDGADSALVWFEEDVSFNLSAARSGQPITHPAFNNYSGFPNSSDLGVVLLDEPVDMPVYATLPTPHVFDDLANRVAGHASEFTVIGFGLQTVVPFMSEEYVRFRATPRSVTLGEPSTDGFNLFLSTGPMRRVEGASCLAQSGGPAFVGTSAVLAGVSSAVGSASCNGTGYYFRLDTDDALEFIRGFLQ